MKKRKTLYYMLPLIVLVWGFVFYQLFSYFFSEPTFAVQETKEVININEIEEDTFSIVADYRDPFLGKRIKLNQPRNTTQNTSSNKRKTKVKIEKKAEKPWPNIDYGGMIKNNNSDRRVGIVKIDGKEYLVKEGDELKEVTILAINKQLVKVRFQKENKTISK